MSEDSGVLEFIGDGLSAAVLSTCFAPLERIKLQLQVQPELLTVRVLDRRYTGIIDCGKRLVLSEGIPSLWRGNTVAVLAYIPSKTIIFATRDQFKRVLNVPTSSSYATKLAANVAAAGLAGATALCVSYPLDFARTRLACDNSDKKGHKFKGLADVVRTTLKSDGVLGLYRGFNVFVAGTMLYRGLQLGLYDSLKPTMPSIVPYIDRFTGDQAIAHLLLPFLLGWSVTMFVGFATYPIDTVSRRMMMRSGEPVKFKSAVHALVEIILKDGARALYGGFWTSVIRGIAGGGLLVCYDFFWSQLTMGNG